MCAIPQCFITIGIRQEYVEAEKFDDKQQVATFLIFIVYNDVASFQFIMKWREFYIVISPSLFFFRNFSCNFPENKL